MSPIYPRAHLAIAYLAAGGSLCVWERIYGRCTPGERAFIRAAAA